MRPCCYLGWLFLVFLCGCGETPDPYAEVVLRRGELELTVDPAVGGRIASLKFRGRELLRTERDSADAYWGSTAWTSPQSAWGWPPPPAFDAAPYEVERLGENRLLLTGPLDSATDLRMRKRIFLGPDSDVGLTYWVTNEGLEARSVALWENTRLPYRGRFEFAAAPIRYAKDTLAPERWDSLNVLPLDERFAGRRGKLFTSLPTGHADYLVDGIRLRKFSTVRDTYFVAPEQAPLELYVDETLGFAEFELQGVYRTLEAGQSNNLRVRWKITPEE